MYSIYKKIVLVIAILSVVFLLYDYNKILKKPAPKPLPKKIEEKVKPAPKLIGSYTTNFNGNDLSRSQNIRVAVNLLNNTTLKPGEIFSFNKTIGEITPQKGFLNAPIIEDDGSMKPGLGGGICQVSSTLYNAVLYARLEVLERHPHSKPVNYVPPGRDATVYVDKDLKFKNNKQNALQINGKVVNNQVSINIYQIAAAK